MLPLVSDRHCAILSGLTESNGLRDPAAIAPPKFKSTDLQGSNSVGDYGTTPAIAGAKIHPTQARRQAPTRILATRFPQNGGDTTWTPRLKVPAVQGRARGALGPSTVVRAGGDPFGPAPLVDLQ
jgi:hypothetical protein